MPLYQLLIAFVLLVGFVAVLRLPGLGEDQTDVSLLGISQQAFPDWFVGFIGSAGILCALVPGCSCSATRSSRRSSPRSCCRSCARAG